jgi:hypothetical protein
MKKIIVTVFSFAVVSCSVNKTTTTEKKGLYEVLTQQSYGGGNIRFFEILSEPNEIKMLQNDEKLNKKISAQDVQNSNFVILNMGEKASGGYTIGIDSVRETDENIVIKVKETAPKEGAMVTLAITYPFCVVKINSKKEIVFQ